MSTDLVAAYDLCEQITRTQARNFSYGIRLLPTEKRRALSAVYAVARRIDDIGDGPLPASEKLVLLDETRQQLHQLADGTDDEVLYALADAAQRFPIPLAAFDELLDGCEADVHGRSYDTIDELVGYCRQVAGSVGRLSLGVFDPDDQAGAEPVADALGVALQLTNILRDVAEDAATGRVYLPATDLAEHGLSAEAVTHPAQDDRNRWLTLLAVEVDRAEQWYARGLPLLPMLDRRSAGCTGAMAGIYHRLLRRIAQDPAQVLQQRVRLPTWEKALVAVRALTVGAA